MIKKILIIGFGNIGFRHAESLLGKNYSILIVDPQKKILIKYPSFLKKKLLITKILRKLMRKILIC
jgi:3-hydroxyacyl-CoA dehydrogenase